MAANISISTTPRTNFGAAYPVTYVFTIPTGSSGLTAEVRYDNTASWGTLPVMAAGANGVDGARFDYPLSIAYLTVAFDDSSDNIYLRVMDGPTEVTIGYVGVSRFYDNRACPVIITWDDWGNTNHDVFVKCATAHRDRGLWASTGVNPAGWEDNPDNPLTAAQWTEMQGLIDDGFLEPNNHGHRHADPADVGYDEQEEIGDGHAAIIANLTLPPQSRVGASQYVLGWVEPYGNTNSDLQAILATNTLLNQRRAISGSDIVALERYAGFDATLGVFDRQFPVMSIDNTVAADGDPGPLNDAFDICHRRRLLFHAMGHPYRTTGDGFSGAYDWDDPDSPVLDFLDYVAGRDDVWYVGWGHLYMYQLTALEVTVSGVDNATLFYDDFESADIDGLPPVGWSPFWRTSPDPEWQVIESDGTKVLSGGSGGLRNAVAFDLATNSTLSSDVEVLARVRQGSDNWSCGLIARANLGEPGTNNQDGYMWSFRNGNQMNLTRYDNGGFNSLGTLSFAWSPTAWYWLRFRVNGTALTAKVWADGDPEPELWQMERTDATYTDGNIGIVGLDATYHHFDYVSVGLDGATAPDPMVGAVGPFLLTVSGGYLRTPNGILRPA